MAEVIVEVADAAEFEVVCRLYDDVIAANTGTEFDVLWNREFHPSDEQIADAIEAGQLLLARVEGEAVGAMILNNDVAEGYESVHWAVEAAPEEVGVIHLFCIRPEMQGNKIGRRFLNAAIGYAREKQMKVIRLDVFDYNLPAKKLYESAGFQSRGVTRLGYEDQDAVGDIDFNMMELAL